jgi:hypothetical protein
MKANRLLLLGAFVTLGLAGACRDNASYRDTSRPAATEGTGGSGNVDNSRIGDGKIGENNGVIDDGEGPLENDGKADDKVGNNPGVWNDGEGPIENSEMDRPEK